MDLNFYKEQIVNIMLNEKYSGFYIKDFYTVFDVKEKEEKNKIHFVLEELEKENKVIVISDKYYIIGNVLYKGIFEIGGLNFGFVRVDKLKNDIFVLGRNAKNVFDGDEVFVLMTKGERAGKKASGRIVKILEKKERKVVGVVEKKKDLSYVLCNNKRFKHRVILDKRDCKKLKSGDIVKVRIIEYPLIKRGDWRGRVIERVGSKSDKNIEILSLISEYDLPNKFSKKAIKEAKELLKLDTSKEKENRVNLRNENIFTIDGIDAKDLDDAVSIKKTDDNYNLKVSIADVSFYVGENTNIDKEAFERGNSVYFPIGVIPMLPRELCENLCSLNENEDKLTFTCDMTINKKGKIIDYKFYKSIINSKARFVYDYVNELFDKKNGLDEKYYKFEDDLLLMKELASLLEKKRKEKGSIDFDTKEALIVMDDDLDEVVDVKLKDRGIAERIIEEFMLVANTCACEYFVHTGVNGVFRAHDEPDMDKLKDFSMLSNALGYKLKLHREYYGSELCSFLERIKGKDEESLLKRVLLRCMKKAEYTAENKGHFALAKRYYTHFTSPIRRYPDLIIHRILSDIINGNINFDNLDGKKAILNKKCKHLSGTEVRSEEVERIADKIMMVKYMSKHIGEEYDGVISGVNKSNIFVEINNGIEGFVALSSIKDDYYIYDEKRFMVIGKNFRNIYRMGDRIRIKVIDISYLKRNIEFSIID